MSRIGRPLAVLSLSGSTLAYEVLLVRVFAIEQFHHFAYLAVGVAMLGFGASGTALAVMRARRPIRPDNWLAVAALGTPLALLAVPAAADLLPIDPTRLAWDLGQGARLLFLQALLAVPFALGALGTLAALFAPEERPGLVYGASFLGAGLGALAGVAVLAWLDPERALALPPLLAVPAGSRVRDGGAPSPRYCCSGRSPRQCDRHGGWSCCPTRDWPRSAPSRERALLRRGPARRDGWSRWRHLRSGSRRACRSATAASSRPRPPCSWMANWPARSRAGARRPARCSTGSPPRCPMRWARRAECCCSRRAAPMRLRARWPTTPGRSPRSSCRPAWRRSRAALVPGRGSEERTHR